MLRETKNRRLIFRNECLCRAMVDFSMLDIVSHGIKKMLKVPRETKIL